MTEKHRSVNNVLWRVVAGRIRRVAVRMRPAAASWTPLYYIITPTGICTVLYDRRVPSLSRLRAWHMGRGPYILYFVAFICEK